MDQVMVVILSVVLIVLLLNFLVALFAFARRGFSENWLLVVLLTGTTGAGMVALLIVLESILGESLNPPFRLLDVALILTGTAALTAAVRAAAGARTRQDAAEGHDTAGSTAERSERL
ncbi:hypothetical protein [Nesterenkonia ebinurensis]|uniref:hypothetical protein n=1 Tax=Nesterenkonia ebinurensis TaxID=2608252 RepID=UPI00123DD7FF|nr:hypothetical protein [Nesterenkonia ebinurensis]